MARSIGMDNGETFRAVRVLADKDGKEYRLYEGPYSKPGPARARVSYWRNHYRRWGTYQRYVDGFIERSVSNWERVPE